MMLVTNPDILKPAPEITDFKLALSAVLVPYILRLASPDWRNDPALAAGINVDNGEIVLATIKGRGARDEGRGKAG